MSLLKSKVTNHYCYIPHAQKCTFPNDESPISPHMECYIISYLKYKALNNCMVKKNTCSFDVTVLFCALVNAPFRL